MNGDEPRRNERRRAIGTREAVRATPGGSSTISEKIRKQLAALPARPGVYLMRNAEGEVIYVGKAAKLKDRVRSYFGSPHMMEPKTRALRAQIDDFEYIVVGNAGEALILEATLIKRHQPFFNIRLKDDKRYPYLKVDIQNPWPRVYITRRIEKDGARYFGPYASAGSVRATLDLTKKLFPWRSCTKEITGKDARPCLDYYIKRCIAPCTAYCTKEEYDEVIEQVILFLEGKADDVLRRLRKQMDDAAGRMEYEGGAPIRDQLKAWEGMGYGKLPVCIAKTQYSFTTDPNQRGAPTGFTIPVREVRLSAGAGFIVAICGEIMTMPGLPKKPSAEVIRFNEAGQIDGHEMKRRRGRWPALAAAGGTGHWHKPHAIVDVRRSDLGQCEQACLATPRRQRLPPLRGKIGRSQGASVASLAVERTTQSTDVPQHLSHLLLLEPCRRSDAADDF